jgi:hypothetical protein
MGINEMFTTTGAAQYFTLRGFPMKSWHIRRAYERELIPEPKLRFGQYRIISSADLPSLEKALVKLGYLPGDMRIAA